MAKNHSRQPTNRTQMQKQNIRTFNLFTFTFFEAGFIRWHTTYRSSSHSHTHTHRETTQTKCIFGRHTAVHRCALTKNLIHVVICCCWFVQCAYALRHITLSRPFDAGDHSTTSGAQSLLAHELSAVVSVLCLFNLSRVSSQNQKTT